MSIIETQRLIIRPFKPDDWEGIQVLAIDKERNKKDPNDPPWPTSDIGCKEFTAYLALKSDMYFAVCLKSETALIGLLAFNHIDENKQLELGYQIHSRYQNNDFDREALESIIDFIFTHKDVQSIDTRTNPEWMEQVRPLKSFGFAPIEGVLGHLGITKTCWEKKSK